MLILSLDTAMAACSAAVFDTLEGRSLAAQFVTMERGHAEALAPMVADVMRVAGVEFPALDRVAVTAGPGTFTGVRIALSFARGLGLARGIPVIGLDTLSAIAANERAAVPLLVASDARGGEVYAAVFDAARDMILGPRVATAAEAAANLPPGTMVLGTAAVAVIEASERGDLLLSAARAVPDAARFAALAAKVHTNVMPSPIYLRAPDARPQAARLRAVAELSFDEVGSPAAELLARLHGEIFEDGWSEGALAALLDTPGTVALIAREYGEPVAFILTRSAADEAEIVTLGTRPTLQRRGIAHRVLEAHARRLAQSGIQHLFLEVAQSNTAARALYQGAGFQEVGRRKGYYKHADGREDAIVLRRDLRA